MDFRKVVRGAAATFAMMCLLSFGVAAQDRGSSSAGSSGGQLSSADKTFVMHAAQGGMAEVQLGQLAADKASSPDVKKFGQKMVDDHSKANDQLKSIAQQKGITLPTDLSAKDKALKDKLSGMSGAQFDKMYMQSMVADHKKDVAEFQKESTGGKDPDVKSFASQTLPILQGHLLMAQQTAGSIGASASSGKSSRSDKGAASSMADQSSTTPKQ
jgi:putative membrane protein